MEARWQSEKREREDKRGDGERWNPGALPVNVNSDTVLLLLYSFQ